jgi:chromosome segregation ATPase
MSIGTADLASIYSRLAVLESQHAVETGVLDEVLRKHNVETVSREELNTLETRFNHAALQPNSIGAIKDLFSIEHNIKDELARALDSKLKTYQSRNHQCHQLNSDTLRLQETIGKLSPQLHDMTELCRKLQVLEKEKNEHNAKLLAAEVEKSGSIQRECGTSLSGVTTKIDAEEADLEAKAQENTELRTKLDQFHGHLELRREKIKNEARTRDLQKQLDAAQTAQRAFLLQQEQLRRDSVRSKVVHAQETVLQLESQLGMYDKKFAEFQDTLQRTGQVMAQLDEREAALQATVARLRTDNAEWKSRGANADVALIEALEGKEAAQRDVTALKADVAKAEKQCRQLQVRRQQQQQQQRQASASAAV